MKNLRYISDYTKFILMGHLLNPLWHDRLRRRKRRGYYNYRRVNRYLEPYLPFVKSLKLTGKKIADTDIRRDNKIFSIWFQGEENAPRLVKACFQRLRQFYGDRVVILDNDTLWEWVTLPEYIKEKWERKKIVPANFSDICRVALLHQHGGMWFDATDYLTSRVPQWIEDSDLFIYMEGGRITPYTFIQSCFMRGVKGNELLGGVLELIYEYWKKENKAVDYFLFHFLFRFLVENNEEAAEIFERMPKVNQDPTHNLWFKYLTEPYSDETFRRATEGTFFQKTTFKSKQAFHPNEGTIADYIINNKIKSGDESVK